MGDHLYLTLVLLTFAVSSVFPTSLTPLEFNEIYRKCYESKDTVSQPLPYFMEQRSSRRGYQEDLFRDGPPSQSVESLIALIEKIEQRTNSKNAGELALAILRRYRFDFISGLALPQSQFIDQYDIEKAIFETMLQDAEEITFEDALTEEENCSLHYMLSHNIYQRDTEGQSFKSIYSARTDKFNNGRSTSTRNGRQKRQLDTGTTQVLEYGVGSFRNHRNEAIVLNKLLLGVAAGFLKSKKDTDSVNDVLQRIKTLKVPLLDLNTFENREVVLDPILAVTYSSVLGTALTRSLGDNYFGAEGSWNDDLCTYKYQLSVTGNAADKLGTRAALNGMLDAYNIGKEIVELHEVKQDTTGLTLSQILRLYYSRSGLKPVDDSVGYCRRYNTNVRKDEIMNQARAYSMLMSAVRSGGYAPIDNNKLNDISNKMLDSVKRETRMRDNFCDNPTQDKVCETNTDLFVLVDTKQGIPEQVKLISKLANEITTGINIGTITVLSNTINGTDQSMQRIAWNETDKGCLNCKISLSNYNGNDKWRGGSSISDSRSATLLDAINKTLSVFEENLKDRARVPSRPFIIFNNGSYVNGNRGNRNYQYDVARENLYRNHRDVNLIVVGGSQGDTAELLSLYTNYDSKRNHVPIDNKDESTLMRDIKSEICNTPSVFQFAACVNRTSNQDEILGAVSQNAFQYWALFPEYFIKSKDGIKFEFSSTNGEIRVCFGRAPRPDKISGRDQCKSTNKNSVQFEAPRNPCEKRDGKTCPPYYFTIEGLSRNSDALCLDPGCESLSQITWKFKHSGLSCNSGFLFSLSLPLLLLSLITAILYNKP